jgi:hypothetical protein
MRPTKVESSYLKSLQYFEATKVLRCRMADDNAVLDFIGVTPKEYQAVLGADSHGHVFSLLMASMSIK